VHGSRRYAGAAYAAPCCSFAGLDETGTRRLSEVCGSTWFDGLVDRCWFERLAIRCWFVG